MTSSAPAYDTDNVFAKILRGEVPCHKVYEDDKTLVFMDIMPRSDGHTLIIPKAASRNLLDIEPGDLQHIIVVAQKVARAAKKAFEADGITLSQVSEAPAGQEVFHTHFHVIPRYAGKDMRAPVQIADHALLAEHAKRVNTALG